MKQIRNNQSVQPLNLKNQNKQIQDKQRKSSHTLALYSTNNNLLDDKISQSKLTPTNAHLINLQNDQNCNTMFSKSNRKYFTKNKQLTKQNGLSRQKLQQKSNQKQLQISKQHQKQKEVRQIPRRFKTAQNTTPMSVSNDKNQSQFLKTFYNTSQEFIRTHKPFLQNKRIIFNVKNRRNGERQYDKRFQTDRKLDEKQTNIEKLKKQIKQLDKQDFVSYRSKYYSNADEIKIISNDKISKYNYQNSMIVEWKGKAFQKPCLVRPSSTMGVSQSCGGNPNNTNSNIIQAPVTPTSNYLGFFSHTSAPKKYFSKPRNRKNYIIGANQNTQVTGTNALNNSRFKLKTQQIAIGLNMFRGKIHRKKVNSSFQIHCC